MVFCPYVLLIFLKSSITGKKLNTESPYDLAVTSRYTIKRNEAGTQTGVCATMFRAALFTMAKKS